MTALDFSTVLAIGIHDMKNSLNRVITAVDELVDAESADCHRDRDSVVQLQYEARRMRDNLTKMLAIYRNDHGLYQPSFAPVSLYELLEDCWLNNKPLMDLRGLSCTIKCPADLTWTLDQYLVASLIENVLTNTMRYTAGAICLAAEVVDGWLCLTLDDDGPGFPAGMLGHRGMYDSAQPDAKLGNTGLGLHFCAMVADLHSAPDNTRGWIELNNGGRLGGGQFLLKLPELT